MNFDFILALTFCTSLSMLGQAPPSPESFTINASVSTAPDGTLVVTAPSLRPVWQTIDSVRRRYGWTVDYEDPVYPPEQITQYAGRPILVGGVFVSHIHEPKDSSPAEEQRVLQEIVDQYNAQNSIKFSVRKISNMRFDVAPATGSLLDKPVLIDDRTRSLHEEVDEVLSELTRNTGAAANQGGFVDNAMEQNNVSLKHSSPVPARQLLNEILNHSPVQKVWLFTYEPNGGTVGIGFDTTSQNVRDSNGLMKQFPNPYYKDPQK